MCPIRYSLLSDPPLPKKKKRAPFLTGDINLQSSDWNNRKMKIAYILQAFIVYVVLCFNFQEIATPNANINVAY